MSEQKTILERMECRMSKVGNAIIFGEMPDVDNDLHEMILTLQAHIIDRVDPYGSTDGAKIAEIVVPTDGPPYIKWY